MLLVKWIWKGMIHLPIRIPLQQVAQIWTWIILKLTAMMSSFYDPILSKLMCDQTSLTRVPHQVKTQEEEPFWAACSIKVRKEELLLVLTGVSISKEMSLTRLIRLLRLNKGMRQTMIVMCLWGQTVIHPRTILMKKRCIETFIASKILRRRSIRERLENKNFSTKFKPMSRPSKIYSMLTQDRKHKQKMSKRSRSLERNHRIVQYRRSSTWQRARKSCCMMPRFITRVKREQLLMTRNRYSRPHMQRKTAMKVILSVSKQRTK